MFNKVSYSADCLKPLSIEEKSSTLASEEILERLEKFALKALSIAPKSDDFLYFSIIFLKAAEASLIDDRGELKRVGSEQAWGHFDEKWRWHGNVNPHKNRNMDIFPELELKKAYKKWIGMPLCVDHKSDSVDGVRGVILDTHYDEKLKQVVGLCALDKKAYPDLARKVETGVVRYGSMGTAVGISVCSECGNFAKVASEFCNHVKNRSCWGEINVDLKPIEYSLVVQPAEPGAILLKCIASIKNHAEELKNFGVDDLGTFLKHLSSDQTKELDAILTEACGENGCSITDRQKIVKSYLNNIEMTKTASSKKTSLSVDDVEKFSQAMRNMKESSGLDFDPNDENSVAIYKTIFESFNLSIPDSTQEVEKLTTYQNSTGSNSLVPEDNFGVKDFTGTGSSGMVASVSDTPTNSFDAGGVGPEKYSYSNLNLNEKSITNLKQDNIEINSILEDIMSVKKSSLKTAYMQGANGDEREPSGYKSEDLHKYWEGDKHMHQDKSMGGDDGMFPGDGEKKEKLSRADLIERSMKRKAYMQGGTDKAREPSGYKSEDLHKYWNQDRHMLQGKSMGGDDGMFPGDKEQKEKLSRAAYQGPALSTKFKQARNLDGSVNKKASVFEVYAGDELVISNTAEDILGPQLEEDFGMLTSQDFAKTVVAKVRELGLNKVASKLGTYKTAQVAPPAPADANPLQNMMEATPDMTAPVAPEAMSTEEVADTSDMKVSIETALNEVEDSVDKIRDLLSESGDGADGQADEKLAFSSKIVRDLKLALAEAEEVSEELHYVNDCLNEIPKLATAKRRELLKTARSCLNEALVMIGEGNTLVRVASLVKNELVKTSEYVEQVEPVVETAAVIEDDHSDLIAETLALRAAKRENLLKKAKESLKKKSELEVTTAPTQENSAVDGTVSNSADDVVLENDAKDKKDENVHTVIIEVHSEPEMKLEEKESKADDMAEVKAKLAESFISKKSNSEKEVFKVKCRRAYELALDMQKKGMIDSNSLAVNKQVDDLLNLDDSAFESFKRIVSSTKTSMNKSASVDLGGINNGIQNSSVENTTTSTSTSSRTENLASSLAGLFSKSK